MRRLVLAGLIAAGLGVGTGLPLTQPVSADACLECYEDMYWEIPVYTWEDYLNDILEQLEPMGPIGP